MSKTIHYTNTLIIGQGLAGSILGWKLIQEGQSINIVCDEDTPPASRVAAGLFNPITGQRLILQQQADHIIPTARHCYHELASRLERTFFHDKTMLRVFKDQKEIHTFEKRRQDKNYAPYIGEKMDSVEPIQAPHGLCKQRQTGYLDTNALLDSLLEYFISKQNYIADHFDYCDLKITHNGIIWKHIHADRIIFCQGFMDKDNPWFDWLPFQPAKGEILTLTTDASLPDQIINGGKWLLPLPNGQYKTGATYSHDLSTIEPMQQAKIELLNGLQKLFQTDISFDVIQQQAGVRPNTLDKQPFIGFHPEKPQIGIFNGFGSKGSMLIPHYAQALADHLCNGSAIPSEADIARINKTPGKSTSIKSSRVSLTDRVHQNLAPLIQAASKQTNYIAIDATAGNGHDALFLARHIAHQGKIFAFDIQKQAIDNTYQRLKEAELADRVSLFCTGHETMLEHIPKSLHGNVNLIMFNLGYLPRADKSVITHKTTTIQALNASMQLIAANGRISILTYPGHAGGDTEMMAVISWLENLPASFTVIKHKPLHAKQHSPQWFEVIRQKP